MVARPMRHCSESLLVRGQYMPWRRHISSASALLPKRYVRPTRLDTARPLASAAKKSRKAPPARPLTAEEATDDHANHAHGDNRRADTRSTYDGTPTGLRQQRF